jgi:hypothetical protein
VRGKKSALSTGMVLKPFSPREKGGDEGKGFTQTGSVTIFRVFSVFRGESLLFFLR